ncbi:MAG: ABC transporter ATP-binding protein [Bacillaceae bacterium]|uniref:Multidrug ABC transporter ATP-binding protein n=1 Tax=Aeribacillus pallidus TaxID=33936 RepID=A0A165X2K1_9BACI|nr:ABC transporter ATP-binding protein [Aeribacillus pallidus]AXI38187.1 ABC transporter ATP-binding protein [Bacillaceae bacterium ZC4]REJ19974.1 MAG: ABC transporter ATP-binding protein [Bacillaceae bacterium]KZN95554.1 multidrug ABC transporter ATP-binding protein [Aeribacillus pallidus]RZI51251.1 ABC transporter ATP-binding protein [Aeribacillus pallidus]BBU41144.1 ABC transporter ATP-binding protein [Aeribacillus pallidus]
MLIVDHVSKYYGNFIALENVHLQFDNGIYGLLAPNGAGKTTLMKMLVTLIFPTKGEIRYNGENIIHLGSKYRELLGYLPQQFGYYKHYTPAKYLLYLSALKGISKHEAKEKIPELLKLVGLEDVMHKKMRKFSGGMIQRVGIAQALLNDPKILILDEPTAGLDPTERARFRKLLTQLANDRIIILSTHIVSDVESIANEIIMIKDKTILYKKPIRELCQLLSGRIYETAADFQDAEIFRKRFATISEKQENGQMIFRFVSDEQPNENWKSVEPTLEDVFLHVYGEGALA